MNIENEISTQTIGQLLREKREEKNLSLKVISHQTKIHIGLLELLENDELSKLPSKIYVRGFVKATSKVLGIETKFALDLLDKGYKTSDETTTEPALKKVTSHQEAPSYLNTLKNTALTSSSLMAKIFIGFIFIAILMVNIKSYLDRPAEDAKQKLPVVLTTVHQKAKPQPKPQPAKVLDGRREENNSSISSMPINIIEDKKEKPAPISTIPTKDLTIELPKAEQKKIIDQYLPAKFQITPPDNLQYVFLNAADGDSWVTYKVDKSEIKKYVLRQGRTLFIHGSVVRLFLGNTRTIKLFYNKNLINFKEKAGPRNLIFPESLKAQYPDPLFIFKDDGTVTTSTP